MASLPTHSAASVAVADSAEHPRIIKMKKTWQREIFAFANDFADTYHLMVNSPSKPSEFEDKIVTKCGDMCDISSGVFVFLQCWGYVTPSQNRGR
jgi:hypothetical protein